MINFMTYFFEITNKCCFLSIFISVIVRIHIPAQDILLSYVRLLNSLNIPFASPLFCENGNTFYKNFYMPDR